MAVIVGTHREKKMVNNVLLDGGSKGECYNKWINTKINVTTTLANSIQFTDG
jgi:hypothetical protein